MSEHVSAEEFRAAAKVARLSVFGNADLAEAWGRAAEQADLEHWSALEELKGLILAEFKPSEFAGSSWRLNPAAAAAAILAAGYRKVTPDV